MYKKTCFIITLQLFCTTGHFSRTWHIKFNFPKRQKLQRTDIQTKNFHTIRTSHTKFCLNSSNALKDEPCEHKGKVNDKSQVLNFFMSCKWGPIYLFKLEQYTTWQLCNFSLGNFLTPLLFLTSKHSHQ